MLLRPFSCFSSNEIKIKFFSESYSVLECICLLSTSTVMDSLLIVVDRILSWFRHPKSNISNMGTYLVFLENIFLCTSRMLRAVSFVAYKFRHNRFH